MIHPAVAQILANAHANPVPPEVAKGISADYAALCAAVDKGRKIRAHPEQHVQTPDGQFHG